MLGIQAPTVNIFDPINQIDLRPQFAPIRSQILWPICKTPVFAWLLNSDPHCKISSRIMVDSTVNVKDPMCRFICVKNVCNKVDGCQTHDAYVTGMSSQMIYKIDLKMRCCVEFSPVIIFVFTSENWTINSPVFWRSKYINHLNNGQYGCLVFKW